MQYTPPFHQICFEATHSGPTRVIDRVLEPLSYPAEEVDAIGLLDLCSLYGILPVPGRSILPQNENIAQAAPAIPRHSEHSEESLISPKPP